MNEFFFGGSAGPFTAAALIGTLFFVIRMGLMLTAGSDTGDGDAGDVEFDADHPDSTQTFKVLSVQSVSAFLMGFGWGGLGGLRGAGWNLTTSLTVGLAAGVGMVWLLGKLLELMTRIQSSGTVATHLALDREGTVYASIPAAGQGRGQVRVIIGDRERFYFAISEDEALETSTRVRVVKVNDDNTVTVNRA